MHSHVSNEIGNATHLTAFTIRILLMARRKLRFLGLGVVHATIDGTKAVIRTEPRSRIEALQSFERGGTFDLSLIVGNDKYRISIKVCTRKTFCHSVMDSNRILG